MTSAVPPSARIAVVGSGPSGMFATDFLLGRPGVEVDVFDRLPTPWGLVRYGVAPDHPKIKSVTRVFERTAAKAGFRFFGDVEIPADLTTELLRSAYHAVVYAPGLSGSRPLGIPGDHLPQVVGASELVAWYNGHPDHQTRPAALLGALADDATVLVVGNGNVALDVARMLARDAPGLSGTDMPTPVVEKLTSHRRRHIFVLGRRALDDASFSTAELRELVALPGVGVVVDYGNVIGDQEADDHSARARANLAVLAEAAARTVENVVVTLEFRFLTTPTEVLGDGTVTGARLVRNRLLTAPDGSRRAAPTDDTWIESCDLVVVAAGYHGAGTAGLPRDPVAGTIRHVEGRVAPREYVVGWAKRGASGVIGTNKQCALDTVTLLLEDLDAGRLDNPDALSAPAAARLIAQHARHTDWAGWQAIDADEMAAGTTRSKPREKLTTWEQLRSVASGSRSSIG